MKDVIVSEEKNKPVLNEETLAKLLEAAYVLQEHNRELRELELGFELKRDQMEAEERASAPSTIPPNPQSSETGPADYSFTLGQIVETQHRIQVRHLDLDNALSLVAERVVEIARARGAGIAITDGNLVRYLGAAGLGALSRGTEIPLDKALCLPCIPVGQIFSCADVNAEVLLDTDECCRRGIKAFIAVPIFHDGKVAGALELYYSEPYSFTEQDIHTCQLMAGLVTEALGRNEEISWKKSLASERAVMLDALEKLKPNLAALVDQPAAKAPTVTHPAVAPGSTYICRKCGHPLVGEEQFCGQCGTSRSSGDVPPSMQSKVASLWHMQEALKHDALKKETAAGIIAPHVGQANHSDDRTPSEISIADSLEQEMPHFFMAPEVTDEQVNGSASIPSELKNAGTQDSTPTVEGDSEIQAEGVEEGATEALALVNPAATADWSSAHAAREFFEQMAGSDRPGALARFWNSRRGDIYLAIAVILVACVIRWGIWSDHPVGVANNPNAAAGHRKSADADLSAFDRMLISLGLAEAPPTPEDNGNPNTQVWIDLHTALYYCPGADLYGKTETGKYATQREAQLDQFEPAYRKACN